MRALDHAWAALSLGATAVGIYGAVRLGGWWSLPYGAGAAAAFALFVGFVRLARR